MTEQPSRPLPTVAILGRPNVGKSTLFNRLVGKRLALVDDMPGVTRDRREGQGRLGDRRFRVIDTAGLEEGAPESLSGRMRRQTEQALAEADVALMVVDARAGVTPMDEHFVQWLRRSPTPVILVANKCEGRAATPGLMEAFALGLGDPVPVSAEHGDGMGELYDALQAVLGPRGLPDEDGAEGDGADGADAETGLADVAREGVSPDAPPPALLQMAVVGRPNVGKSTLVNRLLREDRLLTGPEAGLTRDSIAVDWEFRGQPVRLIDTAGLRRRARVEAKLEKLSGADTLRAVRYAHVVVLVIDATSGLERQDLTIARHVAEEGRALVLALNKWDLVEDRAETLADLRDRLEVSLPQLRGLAVVTLSAETGRNVDRVMEAVLETYALWNRRISTGELNRWLQEVTDRHPPPLVDGRRLRIRFATQVKARPPSIALWANLPGALPDSYLRYLENGLRTAFGLNGIPLRLFVRKGKNPYDTRK